MAKRPELKPWAAAASRSRGRRYPEEPSLYRDDFARDRDRIIHSNAFRRLVYKTQVFVNHEGDLYRTRLTHSLEVAQIARTIAAALGLNEQLSEAICLAHDLGHTPFGHAGQDALNRCMRDHGGFEHNLQSLRVVDELERKYPDFVGLNLTFETREGILKHCSRKHAQLLGDVGERFLNRTRPSSEAQLANLADAIAYNNHDIDDGLRAGLLSLDDLLDQPLFNTQYTATLRRYPNLDRTRQIATTIRGMIGVLVQDVIATSTTQLQALGPRSVDDVRTAADSVIVFSDDVAAAHLAMKQFLREKLYRHPRVVEMTDRAQLTVEQLFAWFMDDLSRVPIDFLDQCAANTPHARLVADYIAGMTDRFALAEAARISS